jgi:hypothetical protein
LKATKRKRAAPRRRKPPAWRSPRAGDPLDRWIAGAAASLDLAIEPAWRAAVRANLALILAQAALVGEFPLPDEAEPAPVYRA